jgi:hypothetical protein
MCSSKCKLELLKVNTKYFQFSLMAFEMCMLSHFTTQFVNVSVTTRTLIWWLNICHMTKILSRNELDEISLSFLSFNFHCFLLFNRYRNVDEAEKVKSFQSKENTFSFLRAHSWKVKWNAFEMKINYSFDCQEMTTFILNIDT